MSLAQQIVQACHAALEQGLKDKYHYEQTSSIVLLQVSNLTSLEQALKETQMLGIECAPFYEPYQQTGLTAFATQPVTETQRHLFKSYPLWGRKIKGQDDPIASFIQEQMKQARRETQLQLIKE